MPLKEYFIGLGIGMVTGIVIGLAWMGTVEADTQKKIMHEALDRDYAVLWHNADGSEDIQWKK